MNAVATPDQTTPDQTTPEPVKEKKIKCVVWDLDQTIWEGVLLEDRHVTLRPGIVEVIQTLDARGILQSIASKNEHTAAMQTLARFGLAEYFHHPISWAFIWSWVCTLCVGAHSPFTRPFANHSTWFAKG